MLEVPGEYTYLLYYIQGAKEYQEAFEKDFATADFSTVSIDEARSENAEGHADSSRRPVSRHLRDAGVLSAE